VGAVPPTTAANFPARLGSLLTATPFGLGLGWLASNFALDIQLQALEGQRRARVLDSPSLLTVDNQPATVASGQKFPIISITATQGAQQASVTFQDVTTRLQVTPRVVGDGRILLTVAVKEEVIAQIINAPSLSAPLVNTRSTITQAEVVDGGTIVIAGLRQERFNNDEQGVPWLSKIPVLGWLFKNDLTEGERRELVVFLTAKIVAAGQAAVPAPSIPLAPGVPAAPGPTGQAPATTSPKALSVPAAPAPPGPTGQAPAITSRSISAAALLPAAAPTASAVRSADRAGER
jgi:type II secretory pathway component HofQ